MTHSYSFGMSDQRHTDTISVSSIKWTAVSDSLPEDDKLVLLSVYDVEKKTKRCCIGTHADGQWWAPVIDGQDQRCFMSIYNLVEAWMELPTPYHMNEVVENFY